MFGFFKSAKGPFSATVQPIGKKITFKSGNSENLLKVALENNIAWPYNCRVGSCGTCKCKLVSGKIKPLSDFSYVLTGEEMDAGYILACQTMLKSDIEVEVQLDELPNGIRLAKSRQVKGKISDVTPLTHDIVEMRVELDQDFSDYLPGQYADLLVPGVIAQARSYSFANAPAVEKHRHASFFIRKVKGGELTEWLHSGNRVGQDVVLNGPQGSFYLREPAGPIVMVAGGSGLAPIRALLQQIAKEGVASDVTLIFGARTRQDLYCLDEIEKLGSELKGKFSFVPVLSVEKNSDGWNGAVGNCPDAISLEMLNVKTSQAYLCGPPVMVDAAINRLKSIGLDEKHIFFDKFLDASSMPSGRA